MTCGDNFSQHYKYKYSTHPGHTEEPDPVQAAEVVVIVGNVEQLGKISPDRKCMNQDGQIVQFWFWYIFLYMFVNSCHC